MERLQRWREAAVGVVAVALVLRLVLPVVADLPPAETGTQPALFVSLAALVLTCHLRPATRHARLVTGLALAAAVLSLALGVLLSVATITSAATDGPGLAAPLLDLVVPLLAVGALALLLTGRPSGAGPAPATAAVPEIEAAAPPRRDPAQQPTWPVDEAAGAAWLSAGDAASGRPAAGWGSAGAGSGWQPVVGASTETADEPPARTPAPAVEPHPWSTRPD